MGGKGSGPKIRFNDEYHTVTRMASRLRRKQIAESQKTTEATNHKQMAKLKRMKCPKGQKEMHDAYKKVQELLSRGLTKKEIGYRLGYFPQTVKKLANMHYGRPFVSGSPSKYAEPITEEELAIWRKVQCVKMREYRAKRRRNNDGFEASRET